VWLILLLLLQAWLILRLLWVVGLAVGATPILDRRKLQPCKFDPLCLCSSNGELSRS
jgi:hypothetical protein